MFYQLLLSLRKPHCICLEQNSIGKRPKDFEASGIPSCILNNTNFFKTSHRNQKNIMSGKVEKFSKQNDIFKKYFFIMRILYLQSFRAIAFAIDKQSGACKRYPLLQGLSVTSVKTTTYVWIE